MTVASAGRLSLTDSLSGNKSARSGAITTTLHSAHTHALQVADLPRHHRDPFDRLLVAQAQVETLALLTADPRLAAYDIDLIWAGLDRSPRS
jgi:PIN domain nuclease of toxin-antitoxin system